MLFRRMFAASTASLLLAAAPAMAQVRVGVHIDIPIIGGGHGPVVVRRPAPPPPPRYVTVYDYSRKRYGDWRKDARHWTAVTLWWWDGRYYEREVPRARRVIVYRYRDQYFREPDERGWSDYRDRYFYRDEGRFYREDGRWSDERDRRRDDDRRGNNGRWDDRRDDRRPEPPRPPAPRDDDRRARPRP